MTKRLLLSRSLTWSGTLAICVAVLSPAACGVAPSSHTSPQPTSSPTALPTPTPTAVPMTIVLMSPAFHSGKPIPSQCTCDGANASPPLAWSGAPRQTVTFVLLMEDVTGATFTHWVLFNVPGGTHALPANIPPGGQLASGARQGTNGLGVVGYYGPCPALPRGTTDDYLFTLYALDVELNLDAGATKQQVLDAASGHILADGQVDGTYKLQNP